jgi:ribosomal protein S18 acetylase RimI-like enzyme
MHLAWVPRARAHAKNDERLAALVIGARPDGTKEVVALEDGYCESTESWLALLRDHDGEAPVLGKKRPSVKEAREKVAARSVPCRNLLTARQRAADEGDSSHMKIERANEADLPAILVLQKLAFLTEAEIYRDHSIPPLTQTEESLRAEFGRAVFLKAMEAGELVGSVRGWCSGTTCHIARLAVNPGHRRRGIAASLMRAIESVFGEASRFELFTGDRSESNIRLYRGLGYAEFKRERLSDSVSLVFMEKAAPPRSSAPG